MRRRDALSPNPLLLLLQQQHLSPGDFVETVFVSFLQFHVQQRQRQQEGRKKRMTWRGGGRMRWRRRSGNKVPSLSPCLFFPFLFFCLVVVVVVVVLLSGPGFPLPLPCLVAYTDSCFCGCHIKRRRNQFFRVSSSFSPFVLVYSFLLSSLSRLEYEFFFLAKKWKWISLPLDEKEERDETNKLEARSICLFIRRERERVSVKQQPPATYKKGEKNPSSSSFSLKRPAIALQIAS